MKNRSRWILILLSLVILCLIFALTGFAPLYRGKTGFLNVIKLKFGVVQFVFLIFLAIFLIFSMIAILRLDRKFMRKKDTIATQKVKDELSSANNQLKETKKRLVIERNRNKKKEIEVNEQKECIKHMTEYDVLTNLYNRKQMLSCIKKIMEQKNPFYILFMDIDDFKIVNDILGSDEADKLLKKIADEFLKLKGSFKIFSRFGGDEFLALIQPHEKEVIEDSIHQIQELFEQGFLVQEKDFKLKISIGVSFYNGNEISVDDMILRAELAMYQVKKAGKNGWRLYDNSLGTEYKEKNRIEDILKTALDEDGFRVVYQPQVDLKSGQIHSYEALIRLNEIDISPQRFIPIAEESDLILKIGRTVLEKAIVHLSKRKELGQKLKVVAVNFSSRQSRDDEYIPFLEHLLQQYSLDSKYIEIEITESILLQNDEEAKKLFSNFKRIGVNLVLDDFGSGYASLEYLTYIPITKLKISKELADKFFEEKKEETIKSIIALAHSLGLKITVEGIEKKWQLDFLKESGCDFIQGYIFSRPVDGKTVEKLEMINFLQEV